MARRKRTIEFKPARRTQLWWESEDPVQSEILGEIKERITELNPLMNIDDPRVWIVPQTSEDPQLTQLWERHIERLREIAVSRRAA